MNFRLLVIAGAALLAATFPAIADDATCAKLSWPLDKERAQLNGTVDLAPSGATRRAMPGRALSLILKKGADGLPFPPSKPGDAAKFSGFVILPVPAAGDYMISLSSEGWIDAVQDGAAVSSTAHTGDEHCPGLRKSVRFTLGAKPLTLQIVNAPADHIEIAITPAP